MNYVNFMRKIEGKEPHDTSNSKASGPRPLDLQGIIEFTRGNGYPDDNLEARQGVPDLRADMFWAGYDGNHSFRAAMGLYSGTRALFYWAGRNYQQQQGDTHSQQQDTVSSTTTEGYVRSDWVVNGDDVNLDEIRRIARYVEQFSVRYTPPPSFARSEPSRRYTSNACADVHIGSYGGALRSTLSAEGSGVSSVRDERSSRERSPEDTRQSSRYRMERGTWRSF
jgi:hypothetical protein